MAHMYDVPVAIRKCEEFLIEKSEKSMRDQLEIAKKYQLDNLKVGIFVIFGGKKRFFSEVLSLQSEYSRGDQSGIDVRFGRHESDCGGGSFP